MSPGVSIFDPRHPRVYFTVAGRPATQAEVSAALVIIRAEMNHHSRDPLERAAPRDPTVIQAVLNGALTP